MGITYRMMCIAAVLLAGAMVAQAQLGGQEVTATISGLFRDANTSQYHNTTLDLVAELEQPSGAWELVADEEYEVEATLDDNEGDRVVEVIALDPDGEIVDHAAADPPVSTLTASGTFTAGQVYALGLSIEAEGSIAANGDATGKIIVRYTWGDPPEPPEAGLVVEVLDMTQGGAGTPTYAVVEIWPPGEPQSMQWTSTDGQGKATFTDLAAGDWIVHVCGIGTTGACDYEFDRVVVRHKTVLESARVWMHREINGKVWFKDDQGQVVGGNPTGVTISLLRGGVPVDMVGYVVNPTANPDGSYSYQVYSEALVADDYVVRGAYGEATADEDVVYPNACGQALPQEHFTHRKPGAHQAVAGPDLVFIVDE